MSEFLFRQLLDERLKRVQEEIEHVRFAADLKAAARARRKGGRLRRARSARATGSASSNVIPLRAPTYDDAA